jgi:hypothetical protein
MEAAFRDNNLIGICIDDQVGIMGDDDDLAPATGGAKTVLSTSRHSHLQ